MWFEILPGGMIIMTCIAMPQFAAWYWNKAVFGNPYKRNMETFFQRTMFTRDTRVSGAPWIVKGLESIPDEE